MATAFGSVRVDDLSETAAPDTRPRGMTIRALYSVSSSGAGSTWTSAATCGTHMTSVRVEMQSYSAHFPHPRATYTPPGPR